MQKKLKYLIRNSNNIFKLHILPKILQIGVDGNMGSTGRIAESIGKLAIEKGWASYIAHGRFARPSQSQIIKIGTEFEVYLHGLETRIFDRHGLGSKQATKGLIEQIKKVKPNIIHLHNLHGYYLNIEILFNYLAQASIPVIWTFHDCWAITGHCSHFDFVGCEKWKTECHHCPQKREYPASWFLDRSRENYKLKKELFNSVSNMTIVSVSHWLNGIVSESFLKTQHRKVIYNGVDIDIFHPAVESQIKREKLNIGDDFMILGVAGVWPKQKGLQDFIELSKRLSENEHIVLVGLNNAQIKGLPDKIIGISRTENQNELRDLYDAADVFLNLSVEETFGLTTAEALACGTPAIVYNSTACPEIIDEYTGISVKRNDIDELKMALEKIKQNGKKSYSAACRERALKHFNKNDRFAEYIELYEEQIKKSNPNK